MRTSLCVYIECVTVAHFEIECRILILLNEILCPNSTLPMPPVSQPHTLSPSLYALFFLSFSPFSREGGVKEKRVERSKKTRKIFSPVLKREDDFRVGRWSLLKQQEHDMTIIKEYRIVLPITVEEYQVAQLYSVAESSKVSYYKFISSLNIILKSEWDRRWRGRRSRQERALPDRCRGGQALARAPGPVHAQVVPLGVPCPQLHQDYCTKGIVDNWREGMERISIL